MRKQKLLIVNWGTPNTDHAFKVAKEKGLDIYLATAPNFPGWVKKYVPLKNVYSTNPFKSEKLLIDTISFMRERNIKFDGITTFFEFNVVPTADLASSLGHMFIRPEAARRSSANKIVMRNYCDIKSIPIPPFYVFSNPEDGYRKLKKIGIPAVIKPIKAGHSIGACYIESLDKEKFFKTLNLAAKQLENIVEEIIGYKLPYKDYFLIEKYVAGDVISVDGLIQDKRTMFFGITKFDMGPLPNFIQEAVTIPAELDAKTKKICFLASRRVIKALEFDHCAFHCEFRLTNKGPVLLEIAARPPGGNMPLAYFNAYGVNMIDLYLDICLGKKVHYNPIEARNVILHESIFDYRSGLIEKIDGLEKLSKKKYFHRYWTISKGEVVFPKYGLPSSLAYYQIAAKDHQQLNRLRIKVKSTLHFKIDQSPYYFYERYMKKFLNKILAKS